MKLLDLFENDPTASPQFRAWFGNSAIVDDMGKPLAVHHGTAIPKTHFRADRHNGIWGSYFTPDHDAAAEHAEMDAEVDGDDPIIYSVYLSIQNPKIVNDGIVPDERVRGDERSPAGSMDYQQLTTEMYKLLIADGYDGVVITNGSIADATEIVASYSHQVKSITNRGGWSSTNLDMHEDARSNQAFRAWFGNSKVVDQNGAPQRVFHGTGRNFDKFSPGKTWGGHRQPAMFFTDDPSIASGYTDRNPTTWDDNGLPVGGNIVPVYLSLQNPLELDAQGDSMFGVADDHVLLAAKRSGRDGIIVRNVIDAPSHRLRHTQTVYVVFDPKKIKSVFNRGSFDQDTNKISEANLTELRILNGTGEPELESRTIVVAFRGRVWLLPWHASMAEESVLRDMAFHLGLNMDDYDDDTGYMMDVFSDDVIDNRPDIIYGYIDDGDFHLMGTQFASSVSPVTSPLIAKLVKQLGLHAATYGYSTMDGDEGRNTVSRRDMIAGLPKKLFHGTSSETMRSIAKTGLRPGLGSNWANIGIKHNSIIFGAVGLDGAVFHANKSAGMLDTGDNMGYDPDSPFPVILEFEIPDPNKVVPDYDVASQLIGVEHPISDRLGYTGQGGYAHQLNTMVADHNPEGRAWKSTGIFGYTGRIPAKFITRVYTSWWNGEPLEEPEWDGTLQEFFQEWNDRYYGDQEDFDETE